MNDVHWRRGAHRYGPFVAVLGTLMRAWLARLCADLPAAERCWEP